MGLLSLLFINRVDHWSQYLEIYHFFQIIEVILSSYKKSPKPEFITHKYNSFSMEQQQLLASHNIRSGHNKFLLEVAFFYRDDVV